MLLLIILIALFLIIFLQPVHIHVYFEFIQGLKKGHVELKYYFIKIIRSIDEGYTTISLDTRFFSKNLKVIYPEKDKLQDDDNDKNDDVADKTPENEDNLDDNEDILKDKKTGNLPDADQTTDTADKTGDESTDTLQLIRKYYPEVLDLKDDLIEILLAFKKIIFLDENYVNMAFGLMDNNATIKLSSFLWAITAPFYATGLRIIITPLINELRLDLKSRLNFQLSLLVILKIIIMIVTNRKLVKLIIKLYKELN